MKINEYQTNCINASPLYLSERERILLCTVRLYHANNLFAEEPTLHNLAAISRLHMIVCRESGVDLAGYKNGNGSTPRLRAYAIQSLHGTIDDLGASVERAFSQDEPPHLADIAVAMGRAISAVLQGYDWQVDDLLRCEV